MRIKNAKLWRENGWIRLSVRGKPYEIGYANGYLLRKELENVFKMLEFSILNEYGISREIITDIVYVLYKDQIHDSYKEYWLEMEGITAGAKAGGLKITMKDIILWNCFYSFSYLFGNLTELVKNNHYLNSKYGYIFNDVNAHFGSREGGSTDRCTGFIAVGDYTKDGKIVCGHNTFDGFMESQFCNVMLDITPTNGSSFIMQTAPGQISSGTDFFVSKSGFILTETTFGGFNKFKLLDPICCRSRKAIQYSNSLDDFVTILNDKNGGDYANAWLIGDTNSNTIMRIELGVEYVNVETKTNGYFIGFNAPYDTRIRNLECTNTGFYDVRRHQGARKVRLEQLIKQHKGKMDNKIAQSMLGDHYDVYLEKENPCSRTCCSHYNLDPREFMSQADRPLPFAPRGCVDGIVTDSTLAKNIGLIGKWGSSCDIAFDSEKFIEQHTQWADYGPYLPDRPNVPWTEFRLENSQMFKKHKDGSRKKYKQSKKNTRKINT